MHCRTCTNTPFILWETVLADGMWYPGQPVFINDWNPRLLTIWKGCLLSAIQRTILALCKVVRDWKVRCGVGNLTEPWWLCVGSDCKSPYSLQLVQKAAVIDESTDFIFDRALWAAWTSLVLSAAVMASSPQQIFACLWRLLVDLASPVLRYRWTMHLLPLLMEHITAQSKTWTWCFLMYVIDGVSLKNT